MSHNMHRDQDQAARAAGLPDQNLWPPRAGSREAAIRRELGDACDRLRVARTSEAVDAASADLCRAAENLAQLLAGQEKDARREAEEAE